MQRLMTNLMYSCRKATELLDKKMFEKLSVFEQVKLYLHTSMCQACRRYGEQTAFIHEAIQQQDTPAAIPDDALTAFKEKVKENIKE